MKIIRYALVAAALYALAAAFRSVMAERDRAELAGRSAEEDALARAHSEVESGEFDVQG